MGSKQKRKSCLAISIVRWGKDINFSYSKSGEKLETLITETPKLHNVRGVLKKTYAFLEKKFGLYRTLGGLFDVYVTLGYEYRDRTSGLSDRQVSFSYDMTEFFQAKNTEQLEDFYKGLKNANGYLKFGDKEASFKPIGKNLNIEQECALFVDSPDFEVTFPVSFNKGSMIEAELVPEYRLLQIKIPLVFIPLKLTEKGVKYIIKEVKKTSQSIEPIKF